MQLVDGTFVARATAFFWSYTYGEVRGATKVWVQKDR